MNYSFIRKVRYMSIAFVWIGILFKAWSLFGFGLFIWVGSYLYTMAVIEQSFFAMLEKMKEERENGEKQD